MHVVRNTQEKSWKVVCLVRLFIDWQRVGSHAKAPAFAAHIGKWIVVHGCLRGRDFIRHHPNPAVGDLPLLIERKAKYQTRDREVGIGRIVDRNIGVQPGVPENEAFYRLALKERDGIQRQETAVIALVCCPQAVFEAPKQIFLGDAFPGEDTLRVLFHGDFALIGRNADHNVVAGIHLCRLLLLQRRLRRQGNYFARRLLQLLF